MNKRVAKKRYKKALEMGKAGAGVVIINQMSVDKNGKPCDAMEEGSRLITLKRPKIQYYSKKNRTAPI